MGIISQTNVLIWRNCLLKRRNKFSLFLEILVPTIILVIIFLANLLFDSNEKENEVIVEDRICDTSIKCFESEDYSYKHFYGFVFPENIEMDGDKFIEDFKKLDFLKDSKISSNFTEQSILGKRNEINQNNLYGFSSKEEQAINGILSTIRKNNNTNYSVKRNIHKREDIGDEELICDSFGPEEEVVIRKYTSEEKMEFDVDQFDSLVNSIGVIFETPFKYKIRYSGSEELSNQYYSKNKNKCTYDDFDSERNLYHAKIAVDKILLKSKIPNLQDYQVQERQFEEKIQYKEEEFSSSRTILGLLMLFYFSPCISNLLTFLVIEKETKVKESLVIVGLKKSLFWLSWAIVYIVIILVSSILSTVILYFLKVYEKSSILVLFFVTFIYGVSNCSIAFTLSTLFRKSRTSIIAGSMVLVFIFVFFFMYKALEEDSIKIIGFFLSPISMESFLNQLDSRESQDISTGILDLFKGDMLYSILGMIVSCILYFILAIYMDNVIPQGYGITRKWHYIFTGCFPKKKTINEDNSNYINNELIQNDPEGEKVVEVKGITKAYKIGGKSILGCNSINKNVVNNVSFNVFNGEIYAILGHNGAGKSTLLNMMTGVLSPTSGNIYYRGLKLKSNEEKICKDFGYCPQYNILNKALTVGEHIKLFAGIKGINTDIDELLKEVELKNLKNSYTDELSGGQKRKLCIALALIGSPKYVFLDEPTTGLDPYSRKKIWELLLNKKKNNCVIFITTHYMDEADIISDRKMILSDGNICCLGTSLYLKNLFNMNYSLNIDCAMEECTEITNIMKKYIPNIHDPIKTVNPLNEERMFTFLIPLNNSDKFYNILNELNNLKESNKLIRNYSLIAPTLEELFINLENNNVQKRKKDNDESTVDVENRNLLQRKNSIFTKNSKRKASIINQVWFMVITRLKLFFRNKTAAIYSLIIPVLLTFACAYFFKYAKDKLTEKIIFKEYDVSKDIFYPDSKWFYSPRTDDYGMNVIKNIEGFNTMDSISFNDYFYSEGKNFGKSDVEYAGGFEGRVIKNNTNTFIIYKNPKYIHTSEIALNMISNAILASNGINQKIEYSIEPFDYYIIKVGDADLSKLMDFVLEYFMILEISIVLALSVSLYGPLLVREREDNIDHQLSLNGMKSVSYWLGSFIGDIICMTITSILVLIIGIIYDLEIFSSKIIPVVLLTLLIWIPTSILYQYLISSPFKKYEKASTFLVIFNPALTLFLGVFVVSGVSTTAGVFSITGGGLISNIICIALLVLFSPSGIMIVFNMLNSKFQLSDLFNDSSKFDEFLKSDEFKNLNLDPTSDDYTTQFLNAYKEYTKPDFFELMSIDSGISKFMLIILITAILYGLILFLKQRKKNNKIRKINEWTEQERQVQNSKLEKGSADIYNEWKRVTSSVNDPNSDIAMKVIELNKDFKYVRPTKNAKKNKNSENNVESAFERMDNRVYYDRIKKRKVNRVVDDITFGVNYGECLGLLGPNGAGKTTSISMITGVKGSTHGKILYGNKKIEDTSITNMSLGFCPQHDALWKLLTLKEHIILYQKICGYTSKEANENAVTFMDICGISQYANKKVSELSGGTKRKLSLIIALCSTPDYIVLDEPSAGMDPFTRRYVWKLIKNVKFSNKTASMLTTHSTEEAEALCERIAIMIKGRLVCIDTPNRIKMNNNSYYILEAYTDKPEEFNKKVIIEQNIFGLDDPTTGYTVESFITYQKYSIEIAQEKVCQVFAIMEEAKKSGLVSAYNFGQSSLEQIYINFVNESK